MADVSVRPARPADAELVARVQVSTWEQAYATELGPLDVPLDQLAAVWLAAVERAPSPDHRLLVALEQSEVVGFATSQPSDEVEGAVELTALMVEPRWGRRGHGSRLLTASVDHWRSTFTTATCWVLEKDLALTGLLEQSGWALDGTGRGLETQGRVARQRRWHCSLEV